LNIDKKLFTWCRRNPNEQARLDFFLTSEMFLNSIDSVEKKQVIGQIIQELYLNLK